MPACAHDEKARPQLWQALDKAHGAITGLTQNKLTVGGAELKMPLVCKASSRPAKGMYSETLTQS